jgi:hypothetical protein
MGVRIFGADLCPYSQATHLTYDIHGLSGRNTSQPGLALRLLATAQSVLFPLWETASVCVNVSLNISPRYSERLTIDYAEAQVRPIANME